MMGIQKLVNNFVAIILMLNVSGKNMFSEKVFISENILVNSARLFGVIEISLKHFIVLIKDTTSLGNEHEVVILILFFVGLTN